MCGIIGYVGEQEASPLLLTALESLEYRGYDSAGIAVLGDEGLFLNRCLGKVSSLRESLEGTYITGTMGLGHTRWATHGRPSEENAHPHQDCTGDIVVVHNGIIENYLGLRDTLKDKGHTFKSETDSEVLAHLIEICYKGNLKEAMRKALAKIVGSYSLAVIHKHHPQEIIVARNQSPLIIGYGKGENFIASDIPALLSATRTIVMMNDMELAVVTPDTVEIETLDGVPVQREARKIIWDMEEAKKGGYEHFMLKEIFDQPRAIQETFKTRLSEESGHAYIKELGLSDKELKEINKIVIISCGTSWHAGLVGRRYIERFSKIPVSVEYAAEFRYSDPLIGVKTLVIAISQSGETADTLAAVKEAKELGSKVIGICNVVDSSITREVDSVMYTHAGPEIGVASTKAFTCQLTVLYLFALGLARIRNTINSHAASRLIQHLKGVPDHIESCLTTINLKKIQEVSKRFFQKSNFLYLGRDSGFAIALEGALKLKEISYIHAEGYHAGEMKHGPIALIDKNMPVVVLALQGRRYDKILSNIEEIKARDGIVIAIATEGDLIISKLVDEVIYIPDMDSAVTPMVAVVPLQLLAYDIAVLRKCNVDQPRNLAKSVTVE
jgi:glucosamine--fructose-6-phosphate aminotransferase (isomerizing)